MRTGLFLLSAICLIIVSACDDDNDPSPGAIVAGDPENADYFSNPLQPDTMIFSNIHTTTRDFDLDDDGVADVTFVAQRDTVYENNNPVRAIKQLGLRVTDPENNTVFISTSNGLGRTYVRGELIRREGTFWSSLSETPLVLSGADQNLLNGQIDRTGNWNGLRNQCLGFLLPRESEVLVWFEMGVLNFDSWIYNGHAAFKID